jgi:hypothetical protein
MAVTVRQNMPYCTCTQLRQTGWHLAPGAVVERESFWLHSGCEKPSIAAWAAKVGGIHVQYHVFVGGPLPEDTAYALRVVIDPRTREDFAGYAPTDGLRTSTTNPDVQARIWEWIG